jgi:hypothetical protein
LKRDWYAICMLYLFIKSSNISFEPQEELNNATETLNPLLAQSYDKGEALLAADKSIPWRIDPKYFRTEDSLRFEPGAQDFSPGWFQQGHEV